MLGYSFEVVYKPELENKVANSLSLVPSSIHLYNLTAPTLIDLTVIKEEVEKDEQLRETLSRLKKEEEVCNYLLHEMLRYKGRLVIFKSSSLIPTILHTYHDSVFGGRSGFLRTYKRLNG